MPNMWQTPTSMDSQWLNHHPAPLVIELTKGKSLTSFSLVWQVQKGVDDFVPLALPLQGQKNEGWINEILLLSFQSSAFVINSRGFQKRNETVTTLVVFSFQCGESVNETQRESSLRKSLNFLNPPVWVEGNFISQRLFLCKEDNASSLLRKERS